MPCYPLLRKAGRLLLGSQTPPHPLFNAVMHLTCEDVNTKIDSLIQKAPAGNPVSFWAHPENRAEGLVAALKDKGFTPIIACPLNDFKMGHPLS